MAKHEYKVGDFVEILRIHDDARYEGMKEGEIYPIEDVDKDGDLWFQMPSGTEVCLSADWVKPNESEFIVSNHVNLEREQCIRQMAHEYLLEHINDNDKPSAEWYIKIATELYDTPIPPPSKQ